MAGNFYRVPPFSGTRFQRLEISRTYYLGKWEGSTEKGFAVVFFDRLTTQTALCAFTVLALANRIFHHSTLWMDTLFFLFGVAVFTFLTWMVVWICARSRLDFLRRIPYVGAHFVRIEGLEFRNFFTEILDRRQLLLNMVWISLANQLFWIFRLYFLVKSFGVSTSFDVFPIVLSVSTLLSPLPISLGGLGMNEGIFAMVFALTDSTRELGFLVAVLKRLTSLLPALFAWGLFLFGNNGKAKQTWG